MGRLCVNRKRAKDPDDDCYMVRISLTCQNARTLDQVCKDLCRVGKRDSIIIKGPAILPPETLTISTKKLPNGEEVEVREITWMPESIMELFCPHEMISETSKPGVELSFFEVFSGPYIRRKLDRILKMLA